MARVYRKKAFKVPAAFLRAGDRLKRSTGEVEFIRYVEERETTFHAIVKRISDNQEFLTTIRKSSLIEVLNDQQAPI